MIDRDIVPSTSCSKRDSTRRQFVILHFLQLIFQRMSSPLERLFFPYATRNLRCGIINPIRLFVAKNLNEYAGNPRQVDCISVVVLFFPVEFEFIMGCFQSLPNQSAG